jgi:hypothetical protein
MPLHWKLTLPFLGLSLFAAQTVYSEHAQRELHQSSNRYFWWSYIRLDSDPLARRIPAPKASGNTTDNTTQWDLNEVRVDPGMLARLLIISAFPAFFVGAVVVACLALAGVSQVLSFMISMPLLISAWYYFVGLSIDRWNLRRIARHGVGAR